MRKLQLLEGNHVVDKKKKKKKTTGAGAESAFPFAFLVGAGGRV